MYQYKFLFFNAACLLTLLLTGCFGPVIVVGEFAPMQRDAGGRPYIHAPSGIYNEIRYKDFSFAWNEKDNFRIYPSENTVTHAIWRSLLADPAKMQSAFGEAVKSRHSQSRTDQEALEAYARQCYTPPQFSKFKLLKLETEKCVFNGREAVRVYNETYEKERDLYMANTAYCFACPDEPEKYLYFVVWSERSRKADFRRPEIIRQGELFFKNFRLHRPSAAPETDDRQ